MTEPEFDAIADSITGDEPFHRAYARAILAAAEKQRAVAAPPDVALMVERLEAMNLNPCREAAAMLLQQAAQLAALQAPKPTDSWTPVTKDGIEVCIGQVWEDMDKRMNGRRCRVHAVEGSKVVMERLNSSGVSTGLKTKVSITRMHQGSTGWKLVS